VTCEIDPHHAEVAAANFVRAGVDKLIDLRVGPARDTLATLEGGFDLAFIDADKASGADYFRSCVRLVRTGGVIIVDNVVRAGTILDPGSADEAVIGTWRLADAIAAEPAGGRHRDADRRRQAARRLRDGRGAVVRPPLTARAAGRDGVGGRRRPGGSGDGGVDRHVDVAAGGVGVRAHLVGRGHELVGGRLVEARDLDVQRHGESEAALVPWADADVGGDGRIGDRHLLPAGRALSAEWKQAA
jgi:hypothetical protein